MASFTSYYPQLLLNEGGYCNYPLAVDAGGETYRGISRVYNPHWAGWAAIDAIKTQLGLLQPTTAAHWQQLDAPLAASASVQNEVIAFYETNYWNPLLLNEVLSPSIAGQLADQGINTGLSRPAKMLQYLLNVQFGASLAVDGVLGPQSIAALNQVVAPLFYVSLVEMRQAFYYYRAGSSLSSTPNMAGWCEFLHDVLHVSPDARVQPYLNTWLARTQVPFVA